MARNKLPHCEIRRERYDDWEISVTPLKRGEHEWSAEIRISHLSAPKTRFFIIFLRSPAESREKGVERGLKEAKECIDQLAKS